MRATTTALQNLHQTLEVPLQRGSSVGTWRWSVRQQMATVRDLLIGETAQHENEWLAARGGSVLRERNALLGRLSDLGPRVLESDEIDQVRTELLRLVGDIRHHVQRLHDLAYDEVQLELGGSE